MSYEDGVVKILGANEKILISFAKSSWWNLKSPQLHCLLFCYSQNLNLQQHHTFQEREIIIEADRGVPYIEKEEVVSAVLI